MQKDNFVGPPGLEPGTTGYESDVLTKLNYRPMICVLFLTHNIFNWDYKDTTIFWNKQIFNVKKC